MHIIIIICYAETIEMIQRDNAPPTTQKPQVAVPPVKPPHKYLPFHPACKLMYSVEPQLSIYP